jgi:serine protease Do
MRQASRRCILPFPLGEGRDEGSRPGWPAICLPARSARPARPATSSPSSRRGRRVAIVAFLATLLVALPAFAQPAAPEATLPPALAALEKSLVDAIAKCEKSVVAIARARKSDGESRLADPDFIPNEYGAGVVVDRRGLILTNRHVLGDIKLNEYAVWIGGKVHYPARVVAADAWSDLAVLKIDAEDLMPIAFGDGRGVKKGQIVLLLGNPLAIARDGQPSAAWGIIANVQRKAAPIVSEANPTGKGTMHHYGTLIQVDARLNLGTSGGALLSLNGEMIGLTTSLAAVAGFEQAAGYAIPVDDTFRRAVDALKAGREVEYGFLGVSLGTGIDDPFRGLRVPPGTGVVLTQVMPGTPAARVGLVSSDIITHVEGQPVSEPDALILHLGSMPVGKQVRLSLNRGGRPFTRQVTLSKKPPNSGDDSYVTVAPATWRGLRIDHATAVPNFPQLSLGGSIDPDGCVALVSVDRGSVAWKLGLRPGLFVTMVDGVRVATPDDFFKAVGGKTGAVQLRFSTSLGDGYARSVPP